MTQTFTIRLKSDFNGHRKGTLFTDAHVHVDDRGRYGYRRTGGENYPLSVVEEID